MARTKVIKYKDYKVVNFITQFNDKYWEQEFAVEEKEARQEEIGSFDKPPSTAHNCCFKT